MAFKQNLGFEDVVTDSEVEAQTVTEKSAFCDGQPMGPRARAAAYAYETHRTVPSGTARYDNDAQQDGIPAGLLIPTLASGEWSKFEWQDDLERDESHAFDFCGI